MTTPITPNELNWVKKNSIPSEVIQVFNELISETWNGSSATVLQKDALARIVERMGEARGGVVTPDFVFKNRWLDVEDTFRAAGWNVKYDKPAYYESYDAYFVFSRK